MIPGFLNVEKLKDISSTFKWSIQLRPSLSARKRLINLKEVFQINENKLPLSLRLKEWITNIEEIQMKHQWYYSPSTQEIYQLN